MEKIGSNVQTHESSLSSIQKDINSISQKVQAIQSAQPQNRENEEARLSNLIQESLSTKYDQKIKNIEQGQAQIKELLNSVKQQLIQEINEQMDKTLRQINQKNQQEDEQVYRNIETMRSNWDQKINQFFEQTQFKITQLENKINTCAQSQSAPKEQIE